MSASEPYVWFDDLVGSVEIPEEGTLSKVLFKDDQCRVVIFAFDKDQILTEHTASVSAIVQVTSGRMEITLEGDTVEAGPGSWLQMPPHMPHSVTALEPSVMLLSMLR